MMRRFFWTDSRILWAIAGSMATVIAFARFATEVRAQIVLQRGQSAAGAFVDPPRPIRQLLKRADEAIEQRQWTEAVLALGNLASGENIDPAFAGQDYLVAIDDEGNAVRPGRVIQRSVMRIARDKIGALPDAGWEVYQSRYGAAARQMLDKAIGRVADGESIYVLGDVRRNYFHTRAGYEASAAMALDRWADGNAMETSLLLDDIATQPRAVAMLGDSVRVLHAMACYAAGRSVPSLAGIKTVDIGGEPISVPDEVQNPSRRPDRQPVTERRPGDDSDAPDDSGDADESGGADDSGDAQLNILQMLEQTTLPIEHSGPFRGEIDQHEPTRNFVASLVQAATPRVRLDAAVAGGNARRNPGSIGEMPLSNLWFEFPTTSSIRQTETVSGQIEAFIEQERLMPPSTMPVRIGDVILMRSTELMLAVDAKTGKRRWPYPLQSVHQEYDDPSAMLDRVEDDDSHRELLLQRVFNDVPYGHLSSDGRYAYLIGGLGKVRTVNYNRIRFRGNVETTQPKRNTLVACELATEGKLAWRIGAEGPRDHELANAYFLGAPLPHGGRLYVITETAGDIHLVCLDPDRGDVLWKQHLVSVESGSVLEDPIRRVAGAMVSIADGVAICPTGAGAVVAVDLADRTLRWGWQHGRSIPISNVVNGNNPSAAGRFANRWDAPLAVISGRTVLVSSVEWDRMYAVDLVDGSRLFAEKNRNGALYLAGVHEHASGDDQFLIVSPRRIQAYDLRSGTTRWVTGRGWLEDSGPICGRGLFGTIAADDAEVETRDVYFVPTVGGEIIAVDLKDGSVAERQSVDYPLGNLVAARGDVMVQSPTQFTVAYGRGSLRRRVEAALAETPDDTWANLRRVELLLDQNRRNETFEILDRLRREYPDDVEVNQITVRATLEAIAAGEVVNETRLRDLRGMIENPETILKFLTLQTDAKIAAGQLGDASELLIEMIPWVLDDRVERMYPFDPNGLGGDGDVTGRSTFESTLDAWMQSRSRRIADAWRVDADAVTFDRIVSIVEPAVRQRLTLPTLKLERVRRQLGPLITLVSIRDEGDGVDRDDDASDEPPSLADVIDGELIRRIAPTGDPLRLERRLAGTSPIDRNVLATIPADQRAKMNAAIASASAGRVQVFAPELESWRFGVDDAAVMAVSIVPPDNLDAAKRDDGYVLLPTIHHESPHQEFACVLHSGRLSIRDAMGAVMPVDLTGLRSDKWEVMDASIDGGLMVVVLDTSIVAIDLHDAAGSPGDVVPLWVHDFDKSGVPVIKSATNTTPYGQNRRRFDLIRSTSTTPATFAMAPPMGDRLIYRLGNQLVALDAVEGHPLWRRDIEPSAGELATGRVDGEYPNRVAVVRTVNGNEPTVFQYAAEDGESLGRDRWSHGSVWAGSGRYVLAYRKSGIGQWILSLVDVMTGNVMANRQTAQSSRGGPGDATYARITRGRELLQIDSDGSAFMWDLAGGREVFQTSLGDMKGLSGLQVMRMRDRYIVMPKLPVNAKDDDATTQTETPPDQPQDSGDDANDKPRPGAVPIPQLQPTLAKRVTLASGRTHKEVRTMIAIDSTGQTLWRNELPRPWGCTLTQLPASPIVVLSRSPKAAGPNVTAGPNEPSELDVAAVRMSDGVLADRLENLPLKGQKISLSTDLRLEPSRQTIVARISGLEFEIKLDTASN